MEPDNPECPPISGTSDRRWGTTAAAFDGVPPRAVATGSAVAGRLRLDAGKVRGIVFRDVAAVERTRLDEWFGLVELGAGA